MKKYLSLLLIVISVFMLTACNKEAEGKLYQEEDFEITLPEGFQKKEISGLKYYYENNSMGVAITVNSESKQLFENAGVEFPDNVKAYAEFVVKANGLTNSTVVSKGSYAQFDYRKTVNGKEYYYYGTTHKAGDKYYMINFYCYADKANDFQQQFAKWADSIKVK